MELTYILFVLVVLLNIITFVVFGIDKKRRKEGGDRISETTMFMLGMFGGSLGATLGMHYFHNKTHSTVLPWYASIIAVACGDGVGGIFVFYVITDFFYLFEARVN